MELFRASAGTPRRRWLFTSARAAFGLGWWVVAHAASGPAVELPRVEISGRHYDNAVGTSDAASQGQIRAELIESRPALRPGEVLEFVPGVIVTQHSGDGKANQYFLRGFNLDHGTDFATSVDGMPVNMPTHAHGQGYSDLNFLIPELVDRITYRKGPYFATHGDFAAAGAADIRYVQRLEPSMAQVTLGANGYRRGLLAGSMAPADDLSLLGALEWMGNDGPWTVPEGLRRRNVVLTLSQGTRASGWSASLMDYAARWTATDQVPERLITAGTYSGQPFGRFDSLDPTDGGSTARRSLSGEWHRVDGEGETRVSVYAMRYRLQLFSNFTYAMDRPATGDQFSQQDQRSVLGIKASRAWVHQLGGLDEHSEVGVQMRRDAIRVGLYDTQARTILATTRDDEVRETLVGLYGQSQVHLAPWLRAVGGLRVDQVRLGVDSLTLAANSGQALATQWSPKLSFIAGPWSQTEYFFNVGRGLHSNDVRGVTNRVDPRTGNAVQPVPALVAAQGWELGVRTQALAGLQSSLALWELRSASELLYVADAGSTEASQASRRRGIEWNNRWTLDRRWQFDVDLAGTHARYVNGARIPNAVDHVASLGATVRDQGPWSASLQWRYLGAAALVEDNSVRSRPSSTFNLRLSRNFLDVGARPMSVTLDIFNLLNNRVDDVQYYYASQLRGEGAAVTDRVVHPAEPRTARLTLRIGL